MLTIIVGIISNLHIPWACSMRLLWMQWILMVLILLFWVTYTTIFRKVVCRFPPHWFESTTLTFMVHRSPCTTNLVLLSRRVIISRRKVHKHGSDMMLYVLLTRFLITRSDKHFYHFSNVWYMLTIISLPFINLIIIICEDGNQPGALQDHWMHFARNI